VAKSAAASVAVVAFALVSAGAAQAAGKAPHISVSGNINVSRAPGNQAEQTVAVNPTNPANIVVISNDPSPGPGLFESISFDGGVTWTTRPIATGADELGAACCDPSLAFDSFGNLFFTYLLSSLPNGIPVALSTDGGQHFTALGLVSAKGSGNSDPTKGSDRGSFADQPSITAGAGSVWVTVTAGSGQIVAAGAKVTGLGGVSAFSPTEVIQGQGGHGDYGDVAIGPAGQVMLTYQNPTGGEGPAKIWMVLDPDGLGPLGFGKPTLRATTNVGGFDYIPAQAQRSVDSEANLAWDRSGGPHTGRLYTIWTSEQPDESNNTDIMFQYTDDAGAHWSVPVRLNDDPGTNSQFNPAIAVDQSSGAIGISWYDARNDVGRGGSGDSNAVPNDDAQIWGTISLDGGLTFAANARLSAGTSNSAVAANGIDYGDYTHDAFVNGVFYPCWSDNSNSTEDNPDGALSKLDLYIVKVTV
jgi:hypothetical protein